MKAIASNLKNYLPIISLLILLIIYVSAIIFFTNEKNDFVTNWLELTKPIIDQAFSNLPIFEKYNDSLEASGEQWRMSRLWNLYAITWVFVIIIIPYLFSKSFDVAEAFYRTMFSKKKLSILSDMLMYLGLFITMILSGLFFNWSFFGKELAIDQKLIGCGMIEKCLPGIIVGSVFSYFLFLVFFVLLSLRKRQQKNR